MQKKLSLIIAGTIFISFLALMILSAFSIRTIGMQNAEEKAKIITDLVQDGLTAHMLGGIMDKRDFFLDKISHSKGVESLWIVRSASVINQFGKGLNNETIRDDIDDQTLKTGQTHKISEESLTGAKLRISTPYIAKLHGNPSCMQCHHAQEGEVLGAISIVFNISELQTNGIFVSLAIFLLSIPLMLIVLIVIHRSSKPLLDLFGSINFVMNEAQKGNYHERVNFEGSDQEAKNVTYWINSLLHKLESTLNNIETNVKKFLSMAPQSNSDLLIDAKNVVHELSDIYQFKRTIEFDEDKAQIYRRIGTILQTDFGLDNFILVESTKDQVQPTIVFNATTHKTSVNPVCRALRTKQAVHSDQFKHICESCKDVFAHHICVPYPINDNLELMIGIWASTQEELEHIKTFLPKIQNYIDAARAELVTKTLMEILKVSSSTDALTGLYNRKYLDDFIEKALPQAKRSHSVYGILMLDIDFFKMVNDTYGHDIGDEAIRSLALILKNNIREADLAFRFGGEEFLVLLYQCDQAMVEQIADKIRLAFEKTPISTHNDTPLYKTLSVGTSLFPSDADSLWKCIKFADIALYKAKEGGRNCVKRYMPEMTETLQSDF